MVLTHNVKKLNDNNEIKKTKFERFKDFVKEKTFLMVVPFVLTFTPVQVNAQETKISYEHEDKEQEVTININKNMKNAHSKFLKNEISEKELDVLLFRQVYSQVKDNEYFPNVKLSEVVTNLKEKLNSNTFPFNEVPVKKTISKKSKSKPKIIVDEPKHAPNFNMEEAVQHFSEGILQLEKIVNENIENIEHIENINSVYLFEEIETVEYKLNFEFKKFNSVFSKLSEIMNNKEIGNIEFADYNINVKNNEEGVSSVIKILFEKMDLFENEMKKQIEEIKLKIDLCSTCSDSKGMKLVLNDLYIEIDKNRSNYVAFININAGKKTKEIVNVVSNVSNEEKEKKIVSSLLDEHKLFLDSIKQEQETKKENRKPKVILTYDISAGKYTNSIPSISDKGVNTSNLGSDLGLSLITPSGFGFNLVGGYSGEYTDFVNSVNKLRNSKEKTTSFNTRDNHLAKMMGGFSYNVENFSITVLGGYKLGSTKEHYPVIGGSLHLTENQFTKLQYEIPLLFKEGQVMNISLEHISQYLFVSSNINYSKQNSVEKTELGNVIRNVYPILNTHNIIGGGFLPFEIGTSTFSPILLLAVNSSSTNVNELQKIKAWSVGPGLGLNVMKKEQPIMSLGYALGIGKYNMKFTDLERNVNSFNYNSSYLTHNLFVRINAPLSDKFSIYSDFNFSRGDAKGIEGIRGPIRDHSSFLLFFKYIY